MFVSGSIRMTVPSSEFATQTEPAPKAIPVGPLPTVTVVTTCAAHRIDAHDTAARLVRDPHGAIADGDAASDRAGRDALDDMTADRVDLRVRLRSSALVTHSAPRAKTMAFGVTPTGIVCTTRFVSGSIRDTVPSSEFVTQTAPPPTAIPLGSPPTSMR